MKIGAKKSLPNEPRMRRMSSQDLQLFTMNLKIMLGCGMELVTALLVLGRSEGTGFQLAAKKLLHEIETGVMFSDAMRRQPRNFPGNYVRVIQCGEASGQLVTCLDRLSASLESHNRTRQRLVGALIYPFFLLSSSLVMMLVMVYGFFPMVIHVTMDAGVEPPALTQALITLSRPGYLLILVLTLALVGAIGFKIWHSPRWGPPVRRWVESRTPLGRFFAELQVLKTVRNLAILLDSGLDLVKSLEHASKAGEDSILVRDAYEDILSRVRFGQSLASGFRRHSVFPRALSGMVGVAEEVGSVHELMHRFCELLEDDLNSKLDTVTAMLEPILLGGLGIVVGTLIVAAFLPINNLVNL